MELCSLFTLSILVNGNMLIFCGFDPSQKKGVHQPNASFLFHHTCENSTHTGFDLLWFLNLDLNIEVSCEALSLEIPLILRSTSSPWPEKCHYLQRRGVVLQRTHVCVCTVFLQVLFPSPYYYFLFSTRSACSVQHSLKSNANFASISSTIIFTQGMF